MTLLGWYLRRGITWMPLLGCCAGAVALAALLDRWPSTALLVLPALLTACAAAAAFCFDEVSLPVVEVTPRGATWRRTARLAVALVPFLVWALVVVLRPGGLPLERGFWWLVGFAAIALTVGLAALASRRSAGEPGGPLAAAVVIAGLSPVVIAAFLDWESPYPVGDVGSGVLVFWLAVAGSGALAGLAALRPGLPG